MLRKKVLLVGGHGYIATKFVHLYRDTHDIVTACVGCERCNARINMCDCDDDIIASVARVISVHGGFDAVVFTAGPRPAVGVYDVRNEDFMSMLRVTVYGPLCVIRELIKRRALHASVTFMSSIAASRGSYDPSYAAVKSSLSGLMASLANAYSQIRFNAVAPGLIEGSPVHVKILNDNGIQYIEHAHTNRTQLKRLVNVNDVCDAINFTITNSSVANAVIRVDCGSF